LILERYIYIAIYITTMLPTFLPRSEELHECMLSGMTFSKTTL